jgi:hypothetical protein
MDSVMGWIDREFSLSAENKKGARLIMSMLEVIDRGVWRTWDADGVRVQSMVVAWASPEASSTSPASTGR